MSAGSLSRADRGIRTAPVKLQRRTCVSVIIPCYNYEHFLPQAVASVLGQTGVDVDVIIVDDASTDGSAEVALSLALADPRIRLVLHPVNMGHIATYNDGLARATGDYVVLLSADDMLAPGSLARSTALMEWNPKVGLVYGYAAEFTDQPPRALSAGRSSWSVWRGEEWIGIMCRRGSNIIMNPEAIVRRTVLELLVGYRQDMPHAADMEFWLRAAAISDVGRVNGPVQAFYRVHGHNMHLKEFGSVLDDITARRMVFDQLLASTGPALRESGQLHRTARRALAVEAVRAALQIADTDTRPQAEAAELLAGFAAETDPTIRGSRVWAAYKRRNDGNVSLFRRKAAAIIYSLRWSLRWRWWRRYGV